MSDVLYQKTQPGTTIVLGILGALVLTSVAAIQRGLWTQLVVTVIALLLLLAVFSTLTIRVTPASIEWWLSFGVLRQRIPLADIDTVSSCKVTLLQGLGIRTNNFRDWMWNVSGTNAVDVRRSNGRHVVLGSPDAAGVIQAINAARKTPG